MIIYASIGNSDDKLTQSRWAKFVNVTITTIRGHAKAIHGEWMSAPNAPFQNACVCFEITDEAAAELKHELNILRVAFDQDSIAWAVAETEFI